MPVPGTQVTLTLGEETTIPTPSGMVPTVGQGWEVELDNISPWILTVNVSGQQYVLAPGVAQLYRSRSGPAQVTVVPSGAASSAAAYVLSNWAVAPDSIPGTFPVVIAPASIVTIVQLPPPPAVMTASDIITGTGSAVQFNSVALTIGLALLADPNNTHPFYIGGSNVSINSAYLSAGQGVVIPVNNGDVIWTLGSAGDHLSVWGA